MIWLLVGVALGFVLPLLVIPSTLKNIYKERGQAAAIRVWLLASALAVPGMLLFVWVVALFFMG
ncbi:hypothetical protein [Blastochloris viridis]|uniref:Uncharacterized protein n=1 Tax=Blastochloris viridis TaxID=1079 RepID=A0A0P0J3W8_BLAVI|nr:hypothetical protein [Blastochloris viridis]ALK10890.1 hypothetical protein BVIR_3131 [Blastochloris viridis]CUU43552.1 hypothetical protein BVIRIDIS_25750 [Blastochloris viridis]